MKVILAEKPSVARDLASSLNATTRCDGYLQGGGYQVTWAFGHLVELQEPGDYDPSLKRWTLESLPFIPNDFKLRLRGDEGAQKQFAIIRRLFKAADSIICATDAGREGELIFRYILSLTGCTRKPAQRLWLSSLTPSAISSAFRSIRPLSDYDDLYAAAQCRSQADWIVGLNATRHYTLRHRSSNNARRDNPKTNRQSGLLWTLGRVQTPVLAMIVRRDDDIRTFVPESFWELQTTYRRVTFRYTGDRFDKRAEAEKRLLDCRSHPLQIKTVQSRREKSLPPQLYDLTELQRDMNRRFGISAADTLAAAQSLYESKRITYPRTDSRYLSKDMRKEVATILGKLKPIRPKEIGKLNLNALPFSSRLINDAKITDHHAIIPTGAAPGALNDRQQKVYNAILMRFIAAFYPECLKEITTVDAVAGQVPFRARGVRIVSPGWTELEPRKAPKKKAPDKKVFDKKVPETDDRDGDDLQALPAFKAKEQGPHEPHVKAGETSPPKHFTENTLLGAMDTAGKLVDEGELREALREKGLGTPATRAATIETLLHRKYIDREKKNLVATDLGRYLIAIVRDRHLTSPELTGEWEAKLKQIEGGHFSADDFMREIADYTHGLVRVTGLGALDETTLGKCPRCGQRVVQGKRAMGCSDWRNGCSFVLEPIHRGRELSPHQVRELLQLGATSDPIATDGSDGFLLSMSSTGKLVEIPVPQGNEQQSATLGKRSSTTAAKSAKASSKKATTQTGKASKSSKSSNPSERGDFGNCPLCESAVIETSKSYSCSRWKEGCGLTIWKTMSGKKITPSMAKKLLRNGETAVLKNFQSKAGKKFDAKLKLVDGKVEFFFQS